MDRVVNVDKMIEELNRAYKGSMIDLCMSPLGVANWLEERATTSPDTETLRDFVEGKWVESEKVQNFLNMSFSECFAKFDFSREAEWWSVVGKTDEERQRNGQKVTTYFRLKERCVEDGGK